MNFAHPAFLPYRDLIETLGLAHGLPALDTLNACAAARDTRQARGLPLVFVVPDGRLSARDYETRILETGEVPTRTDTWHDVLNALVWLRFPRFKAALNAAHGEALGAETGPVRGRRRDALTVLDESGVWVASRDAALSRLLAARAWNALFVARRAQVEVDLRCIVVGHALLEKALAPYPAMTGKCLLVDASAFEPDALEAAAIAALATVDTPKALPPLPIQGVPGWDPRNADPAYYADRDVFRPLSPNDRTAA